MKKLILLLSVIGSFAVNAQTITFNGCHPLFENQDYVFVKEVTADVTGRNIFTTAPVDGAQECGGLGTCEFKILWNVVNSRWEFIADSGNGDFVNPLVVYYNTSSSTPNPPDLTLGSWVENTVDTESDCGGNLNSGNAVLIGAVQSTVLSTEDFSGITNKVVLYPNPASDRITLTSNTVVDGFSVLTVQGQVVIDTKKGNQADVSMLQSGVYFVRLHGKQGASLLRFVKK